MIMPSEVPKQPGLIVRSRLLERLEPEHCRRIRLLHAPAGFGKTELARQFSEHSHHPRALWLDLHNAEGGLEQLCAGLTGLLNLASPSFFAVEEALRKQSDCLIVLDGYCAEEAADKWLERQISQCSSSLQWLICTRRRPAWRIGRWLLSGELLLLDGEALALSYSETELLLSRLNMGRSISVTDLQQQSDGWVAGIRLHLMSLQTAGFRANGMLHRNSHIQDYLDIEVLEGLSPKMRSLLCIIAHAPFVDGPLCAFLADDPLALRQLLEQQSFLHCLPGSEDRFTLFTPLKRILQERYPDQAAPLLAASIWLHLAGAHIEAFRYAMAIPDTSRALISVGQIALRELYAGQNLSYLLEGIDKLGLTWIEQHHQALEVVTRALLLGGRLEPAEAAMQLIAEQNSDLFLALSAELYLHQGQAKKALEFGFRSLDGLARDGLWPQMILCLSCLTRASLALGDITTAKHLQQQGIELSRRKGEVLFECLLTLDHAQIEELAGNLPKALRALDQVAMLLPQTSGSALLQGGKSIRRGWLLILTGQERQARASLEAGLLLIQACRSPVSLYAHALLAQLEANNGRFAAAQQRLANVQRLMHSWGVAEVLYRSVLTLSTARIWLRNQHQSSASQLLSRLREQYDGELALSPPSSFPELHALMGLLQAEALCSKGDLVQAGNLLDAVLERAEGNAFDIVVCQALYALGEVRRLRGDLTQAERLLASATAMALRQGQHNLLNNSQAEGALLLDSDRSSTLELVGDCPSAPLELLSQRELAVLSLIAKGYPNGEIANVLSISPHTVKTHAKHINSKLKVSNRTMAVARAKALGLLL